MSQHRSRGRKQAAWRTACAILADQVTVMEQAACDHLWCPSVACLDTGTRIERWVCPRCGAARISDPRR